MSTFVTPTEEEHLRALLEAESLEWVEQDDYGRVFVCNDQHQDEAENLRTLFTVEKDLPIERAVRIATLARMARNAAPKMLAELVMLRAMAAFLRADLVLYEANARFDLATEGVGDDEAEAQIWVDMVVPVRAEALARLEALGGKSDDMPRDERIMWARLEYQKAAAHLVYARAREGASSYWTNQAATAEIEVSERAAALEAMGAKP